MSERYICAECGAPVEREYRVPTIVRSCDDCREFAHFVREPLLQLADRVPEEERPEDWDQLTAAERMRLALRQGFVSISDLRA